MVRATRVCDNANSGELRPGQSLQRFPPKDRWNQAPLGNGGLQNVTQVFGTISQPPSIKAELRLTGHSSYQL